MPIFLILILNVLLYFFYVGVVSISFGILFPLVRIALGLGVLQEYDHPELFQGIQYFIFIAVLIISLLFFRYFYITKTIELKRDEPRTNGLKLMLVLANSFIALLYTLVGMFLGKLIGLLLINNETIESVEESLLALYTTELMLAGIVLLVSIVLRKWSYFTFTKEDYDLHETEIIELDEEKQVSREDDKDELHIKIK